MIPYAPDRQLYVPSTRAQDIILRQGEAAADSAARSGQIWGNALQDLGGIASGYVQDRAARKQEQAQQQALSKRDAAFMSLLDQSGGMPDPKEVYRIFGPEKTPKVMEGLLSYHQMTQKQGEEAASHIPGLVRGADAMGEGARKQLYPSLVAAAVKSGAVPEGFLPPDYTEEGWKAIKATVLPPEAPQGPIKLNRNERLIENGKEIIPAMPEASKPETRSLQIQLADALSSGDTAKAASIKSAIRQAASAGHIESAPSLKSAAVQDAEGNTILANYDSKSGKYFDTSGKEIKDPKKALGATESNRAASAETVSRIATNLEDKLKDPKVSGALGPAMGRYNTLKEFIGNPPPELSDLAGEIESFALANMGVHGMRSVQGADKIAKLLNAKHTPESLAAAIRGLTVFSNEYLKTVGRGSKASSPSAKPSASRLSATNPKTGEKLYSDDGGETWHK